MKVRILLLLGVAMLLLATSVQAVAVAPYEISWFAPVSGGGGEIASLSYALNATIGQPEVGPGFEIGPAAGGEYSAGFGFWHGLVPENAVYLPVMVK